MLLSVRGLTAMGIVVGMPVASFFLVFKPQNKEIKRVRESVELKETMLAKLKEETARNADLQAANAEIQGAVKAIEARLPSGKEIDSIVRQVSDLAIRAGLQPPAMKSAKPVPAALYMEQPLEMEVEGDFVGFRTFVAFIEKLPRITRIHDLKMTSVNKGDVELKAEFTLSIYFQDEPGTGGRP